VPLRKKKRGSSGANGEDKEKSGLSYRTGEEIFDTDEAEPPLKKKRKEKDTHNISHA